MNVNTASYEWDKLITKNLASSIASECVGQNAPNCAAKGFTSHVCVPSLAISGRRQRLTDTMLPISESD
jgi:hypothetical protein